MRAKPKGGHQRPAAGFLLALWALAGGWAAADTIFLKNGQKIDGHIISESGGNYLVEAGSTSFELSSKSIERVIKYKNRDTSLVLLGDTFIRRQDYQQARRYYQRALTITNHKEVVLRRLRTVEELLLHQDDLAKADEAFRAGEFRLSADLYRSLLPGNDNEVFVREIRKKASLAYCGLAKDYYEKSRHDQAIDELRRAMQLDPLSSRAHALAGHLLASQGKYGSAYSEFELALELDQNEKLALDGIQLLGRDLGEYLSKRRQSSGGLSEARPLTELFGEEAFQGGSDSILYSALGGGSAPLYQVHFDLEAVSLPERGAAAGDFYKFRTDHALSVFLQSYNAGPGVVTMYDGKVPYRETVNYVKRVKAAVDDIVAGRMAATAYDARIAKYARMFKLSPVLVKAIVKVESNFDPRCVSSAGARGLIQLVRVDWEDTMKRVERKLDFDRGVFDPDWNLFVGCHYLRWLLNDFLPKHFEGEFG